MRRLNLVLLATLQLCGARTPGFSIHDDLLAFPQYEVVFSDGFISEKDAEALLGRNSQHPTYSAEFSQPTAGDAREASAPDHDGSVEAPGRAYEIMNMSPHRYICSIPEPQPPGPVNETANELARAEEARELSRAAANGWELLTQLEDSCLYFISGWWSYRFCNNREIVQFHAIPAISNGQPPKPDPHAAQYVLGRVPAIPAAAESHAQQDSKAVAPVPAELQVKGDQRYLVQKLEGGTICDLTGRERTIEVQYHCVPGMKNDRIGWIKEVTICAYVMVVHTPRLCDDVAFMPPADTSANPITCQLIAEDHDVASRLLDQGLPAKGNTGDAAEREKAGEGKESAQEPEVTIGGVVVGARQVLSSADEDGKPPVKLAPPRNFLAGHQGGEDRLIEIIVRAASKEDGGKVTTLSADELEKLEIKPEVVEEMKKQMKTIAGDAGWKLEIVELDGGDVRELRGYVDDDEEEEDQQGGKAKTDETRPPEPEKGRAKTDGAKAAKGGKGRQAKKDEDSKGKTKEDPEESSDEGSDEGSEEKFFKDEL